MAALWRAFIPHSHYDGVHRWGYKGSDRESALKRLQRLKGRPQFISHEGSARSTKTYLESIGVKGNFTFLDLPFRNHTDRWVLRDIPARKALREWLENVLKDTH